MDERNRKRFKKIGRDALVALEDELLDLVEGNEHEGCEDFSLTIKCGINGIFNDILGERISFEEESEN